MSKKKAMILGWVILIVCVAIGFIATTRTAIFGDVPFSEIDILGYLISSLAIVLTYLIICTFVLNKKE